MTIKVILISLASAVLSVGCVAFPDDGRYSNGAYGHLGGYDRSDHDYRYNRAYQNNRNNEYNRARWEHERAQHLHQSRLDQQRRERELNHQKYQRELSRKREQKRRNQAQKDQKSSQQQGKPERQRWNNSPNRARPNLNRQNRWESRREQRNH